MRIAQPEKPVLKYDPATQEWRLYSDIMLTPDQRKDIMQFTEREFIRRMNGSTGSKRSTYKEALDKLRTYTERTLPFHLRANEVEKNLYTAPINKKTIISI